MKVLFVASSRKGHGLSPFINSQKESLVRAGISVQVFLIPGSGFHNYLLSLFQIFRKYRTIHFDIIHAHYGFCGIISRMAFWQKPLIVSFLGDDLIGSVRADGKYSYSSQVFVLVNKIFARYFYKTSIVKSIQQRNLLFNKTPSQVIPNGVDLNIFYPISVTQARTAINVPFDKKVIVFPGNPKRNVKNYELTEAAFNKLNVFDEYLIITLVNINHEDMHLFYSAADVVLLTSFHEGSPNVIKEAMACNCPIVATDVGDVKQIIDNTEGCYLCSYNPEDVTAKIQKAIKFGKRTNGRELIGHLESGLIANKIAKLYEDSIEK